VVVRRAQFGTGIGGKRIDSPSKRAGDGSDDDGEVHALHGGASGGWDVQDVRIDAVREKLAAEQDGMRGREEASEASRRHATELAASLAQENKRLEGELAEVCGERDALRVDLGARPSVR